MQDLQTKIRALDKHNMALLERVNCMGALREDLEVGHQLFGQLRSDFCFRAYHRSVLYCDSTLCLQ